MMQTTRLRTTLLAGTLLLAAACNTNPASTRRALQGRSPAAGPYSPGIALGNLVVTSGQIGKDPATGQLVDGITAQTHQVMQNLRAVLGEGGLDFGDVVKSTVFLANIDDYAAMNEVYASYFPTGGTLPARTTVAVAAIPRGALVEIECIATR